MNELAEIVEAVEPHEILLVCDAMTGQESVNIAKGFDELLDVDGIVLTKLDGDARGGQLLVCRQLQESLLSSSVWERSSRLWSLFIRSV